LGQTVRVELEPARQAAVELTFRRVR
jgi:hypothetical protein